MLILICPHPPCPYFGKTKHGLDTHVLLKHSSFPGENATNEPRSLLLPFRLDKRGRALRIDRTTSALVHNVVGTDVGYYEGYFEETWQRMMSLEKWVLAITQLYCDLSEEDHTVFESFTECFPKLSQPTSRLVYDKLVVRLHRNREVLLKFLERFATFGDIPDYTK